MFGLHKLISFRNKFIIRLSQTQNPRRYPQHPSSLLRVPVVLNQSGHSPSMTSKTMCRTNSGISHCRRSSLKHKKARASVLLASPVICGCPRGAVPCPRHHIATRSPPCLIHTLTSLPQLQRARSSTCILSHCRQLTLLKPFRPSFQYLLSCLRDLCFLPHILSRKTTLRQ